MKTPAKIIELVNYFHQQIDLYGPGSLNETETRTRFINQFFEALGWDVINESKTSEIYRDVVQEDKLRISNSKKAKAPDYSFRIGGVRKFFVEAKKPAVNVGKNISAAYQVRRYGWSAKLPVSILTDFEEFAVYDCRLIPNQNDSASQARIKYYKYTEYLEKWSEIYDLFSKEAVLNGSLEQITTKKIKTGITVDKAFLQEIETWRQNLAVNIAFCNPNIKQRELNFAVQMTINRLIFLRIREDKNIEPYEQLFNFLNCQNIYQELVNLFVCTANRYKVSLFNFKSENNRLNYDDFTLKLSIDDYVLKAIIKKLYPPESPYEFSVIPVEILGQVYEQFLGKVIHLSPSHQAVVEDKPEVRKAGGVYYTPSYIVDYIVKQTVGKLLTNKTPEEVTNITILDPACGSGSFLIGAYQFLLDWYVEKYTENAKNLKKYQKNLYQNESNNWSLRSSEKKRILLTHIYGVDIDQQAVETTKLSLLLKVLEGESGETVTKQLELLQERALPDLDSNIQCGNSLIGTDYYNNMQLNLLDEDEMYRVNVFDWKEVFPKIMNNGGFDVIIGNPPYLRIQGLQQYYNQQINYLSETYKSAVKRFDLYCLFIEKGFYLLSPKGYMSYICSHKFTHADFASGLREFLLKNQAIESLISFGENLIFEQASTYTGIVSITKAKNTNLKYYEFPKLNDRELSDKLNTITDDTCSKINLSTLTNKSWILTSNINGNILSKIQQGKVTIGDLFSKIFQGIVTGIDEIYFLQKINDEVHNENIIKVYSQRKNQIITLEKSILKPLLKGEDVSRYTEPNYKYYCLYPYKLKGNKTVILEEDEFQTNFPLAYQYLSEFKEEITQLRIKYKTNPQYWYACHRGRSISDFEAIKIIIREISFGCNLMLDTKQIYHNTGVYSLIPSQNCQENYLYWLGLLNSKLMWWFLINTGNVLRGGYFTFKTNYLKPFPVYTIDFNNTEDVQKHDRMVELVEIIINLNKQLNQENIPNSKKMIKQQIKAIDRQIDQLVYELYGLTEEEIKIIEES